jgi:ATP/maltotriose-dependent transcriptional regulator MalT
VRSLSCLVDGEYWALLIGRALLISEATVKTHLLRAFGKLGVSDRTAAVTAALALGILPPPG